MSEKDELRAEFEHYRASLDEATYRAKSTAICERAAALPEIHQAETVHAYWPQTKEHEIDTRPLIRRLRDEGKRIVLPRVVSFAPDAPPEMEHVLFTGEDALRTNRWGLREPAGSETVAPSALDAVVVPAFGTGRTDGHRIGHGRGFYDAFLNPISAFTVGLVYAACLRDAVPAEAHDVPLRALVTERETLRSAP